VPSAARHLACLVALAAALLSLTLPAAGATKTWIGGTGQWDTIGNWLPSGQPLAADDVLLTQSDTTSRTVTYYNITNPTAVLNSLEIDATGTGTMTFKMPNNHALNVAAEYVGYDGKGIVTQSFGTNNAATLYLGYNKGSDGTYTLTRGTVSSSGAQYVGYAGAGTATIDGSASLWNSTGSLYVGGTSAAAGGTGSLTAQNGGKVTVTGTLKVWNTGTLTIQTGGSVTAGSLDTSAGGKVAWTNGTLGITGTSGFTLEAGGPLGAALTVDGGMTLNCTNYLYVAKSGTATLTIKNGGQASVDTGCLGYNSVSKGTATVTGNGSKWTNSSLYVGYSGSGTLNIEAGGEVSSTAAYLGYNSKSTTGTVTVTGANSRWNNVSLFVGYFGTGTLTVANGGTVSAQTLYASLSDLYGDGTISAQGTVLDNDLFFDSKHGTTQTLSFGTGGKLNLTVATAGDLGAGHKGTGTLRVADGVAVASHDGVLGKVSGSSGTATVTGAGSKWTNSGQLYVGDAGSGALIIEKGGQVSNTNGYLGYDWYSTGTATVTGTGSKWVNSSNLYVGDDGSGTMKIEAGGEVSDKTAYVGGGIGTTSTATVTGAGSKWTNSAALYVGGGGNGTLRIEDGGQVSSTYGYIGYYAGRTGTATVTGTGSIWTNSGSLTVGSQGSGTLNIEAGGQVSNTSAYVSSKTGAVGAVTVDGSTSTWSSTGSLYVGGSGTAAGGTGNVTVQNGGKVTVSSTLKIWSTGTLTIQTGGSVTVASLDTSAGGKVAWTNGTLGITGSMTVGTGGPFGESLTLDAGMVLNSADLSVANSGSGTLTIQNGGQAYNKTGCLGYNSGSSGTATVSGVGSTWTNSGAINIGFDGDGTLNIRAGGQVNSYGGTIGRFTGGRGTATVTGAGSAWTNSGNLNLDSLGGSTLSIEAGGRVSNTGAYVGESSDSPDIVTVTGTGSTWISSGTLYVGDYGLGTLNVQAAGEVSSGRGQIGYGADSTGTVTVTGDGSRWRTNSQDLRVGGSGAGTLKVQAGGEVNCGWGYLAFSSGSTGTATVTGLGSTWVDGGDLNVGMRGNGALTILDRGQVRDTTGYLGYSSGSNGTTTVTGDGSTWANSSNLCVGRDGTGTLTVANGGAVTACSVSVNSQSAVRLHVSGGGMLVVGDDSTAGSIDNGGTVSFYADAFLAAKVYTPISDCKGRAMTWSGTGSYKGYGGTWSDAAKTFTVAAPTELAAGDSDTLSTGERLLVTDPGSGKRVGASFGGITGSPKFSAAMMGQDELDDLIQMPGFEGKVLSGWDFDTDYSGGDNVLLSFEIGLGAEDLGVWHYDGGAWSQYAADLETYDANGVLSFTAADFSGYAVTAIPEPAALTLLALGGLAMLIRRSGERPTRSSSSRG
jgi:T5SS/PEP-CTERM-associated repeat protein